MIGWRIPTAEELERGRKRKQRRLEREGKAREILERMTERDAIILIAGLRNCSQNEARNWLEYEAR